MVREYIGARYVPKFMGGYNPSQDYEALCVVDNGLGTSYISKIPTPAGTPLTDTTYWTIYGASSGAIINLQNQIGSLAQLATTDKDNLVDAINETVSVLDELTNNEIWVKADVTINTDITTILSNYFAAGKRFIYIPDGNYIINNLIIPESCGLFGNDVIITSSTSPCIKMSDDSIIQGLTINNTNTEGFGVCVNLTSTTRAKIFDCEIDGCYIGLHLNNTSHALIKNSVITNTFSAGLAISAYQSNNCIVSNCKASSDYNIGSHGIQFSNGQENVVQFNRVETAGGFGVAITDELYSIVSNNRLTNSHYEAINLDNSSNCDISGNHCQWDSGYPSHDHGISIYGSTGSAAYNKVHDNSVINCYKAGIALANNAASNNVHDNCLINCCINGSADTIKGFITLYDDAGTGHPLRNLISDNLFIDVHVYGIHQLTGYQNVCLNNMTFPDDKPDYFADNLYELNKRATICPITPAPTISTTGTINSHNEFWDGEYITGTFNADCTNGSSFDFGLGIAPASDRMFECSSNAGAPVYFSMNSAGTITVTPMFTQAGVTFVYKYRANKYLR